MSQMIETVREFIKATEAFDLSESIAAKLLHDEYLQIEFPNLLNRQGQRSNRAESVARMEVAKKILKSQTYDIKSLIESGQTVVMEAGWSGEMMINAGPLKAGQLIKASFCMIFEFADKKIISIRNYDCFEPF